MDLRISILVVLSVILFSAAYGAEYQEEGLEVIIKKAEGGDGYYQGVLGAIYRRGERGETNLTEAAKWLELSAQQGNPIGMYNYAVLYEIGVIVPRDTTIEKELQVKAHSGLIELAEAGDPRAQVCLGIQFEAGFVGETDLQAANALYRKAAGSGFPLGQYVLGHQYFYGIGLEKDSLATVQWIGRAAENGYPAAERFLGNMYFNGDGIHQDIQQAIAWHIKAENHIYDEDHWRKPGDMVISSLPPPRFKLKIPEGSCGEACLWSIVNSDSFQTTQIEVNHAGGKPGRGLHSYELHRVLDYHGIEYTDTMNRSIFAYLLGFINPFRSKKHYRDFLYGTVIGNVKQGNPVILGVKIYPDRHFYWDCDHFVLVVGYNEETEEIIFNDFNHRKRLEADKLLDRSDGYSLRNKYGTLNAVIIQNLLNNE